MKYSITIAAAAATAVLAQAPNVNFSEVPQCGQTCVNNMAQVMQSQYGCAKDDYNCYCTKSEYGWGVRDCANQNCAGSDPNGASVAIAYGLYLCGQPSASSTQSGDAASAATSDASSALSSATASISSAVAAAAGGSTAITTSELATTITSGDSTITSTLGMTTIYSAISGSASSAASDAANSASSAMGSVTSAMSSAMSSATDAGSDSNTVSTDASGASSTGSGNAAPIATQAPLLVGGALLAAVALL